MTKEELLQIDYAEQVFDIYNEYYPEIIEEIKGFAEGQHTDFKIVFAFLVTMYIFTTRVIQIKNMFIIIRIFYTTRKKKYR